MKKTAAVFLLLAGGVTLAGLAFGQGKTKIYIDSWRNDDLTIWQDEIIPVFSKKFPNIEVVFAPSTPAEYNSLLDAKLQGGSAGDLITCRPFDQSLSLYNKKYLASLNDLAGMNNFSNVAKSAWQTDDGKNTFCVPMASVIHGFIYNKAIFAELGLKEPKTEAEFYKLLNTIKKNGKYAPLVMGTKDQWESATMGFQNIGPNYWKGETGRLGLISGKAKYNTGGFLRAFQALAKWAPYLEQGYQSVSYSDAQNLFTLGRGAVYPSGSWEISGFRANAKFELGAFKPPLPAGAKKCYISDHTDIAMGLNANSKNKDSAKKFLEWMTTPEFAEIYANALPGFFSLSKAKIKLKDPLAQEFVGWRDDCESTIRSSYQILSRNEKLNNELELWAVNAQILNGTLTPKAAADMVQKNLEAWYKPKK